MVSPPPKCTGLHLFYVVLICCCSLSCSSNATNNPGNLVTVASAQHKTGRLANLCRVWGFLKYYHPSVASGRYDWDKELLNLLPRVLAADSDPTAYQVMEAWVNKLGPLPAPRKASPTGTPAPVKLEPDFGMLFAEGNLPPGLLQKLVQIRDNYSTPIAHKYIELSAQAGNAVFTNENAYAENPYPAAGLRLLALYRYWNMIRYFYPYRHLVGQTWDDVLDEFIPRFIEAADKEAYTLTCLELIGHIHDSHAGIAGKNAVLDTLKGSWITPFKAAFIENKLVVTGFYQQPGEENTSVQAGDIIEEIDGQAVASLINRYLPLTPASNYATQLRDMAGLNGFLLRGRTQVVRLKISNEKGSRELQLQRIPLATIVPAADRIQQTVAYKMLPGNIGYIYPGLLANGDFVKIRDSFARTRGLIIDFRCYPSSFMPFTYGQWFKGNASPFAYFTRPNLQQPGSIVYSDTIYNGMPNPDYYPGKIIIIVNARTQSQAEYSTMALSTAYRVKVLGSTTAGADGNVSKIVLPGGIQTMISGLGVYYPDGRETQRSGIKIDIPAEPTIAGVRAGRDELLEKAIALMKEGQ